MFPLRSRCKAEGVRGRERTNSKCKVERIENLNPLVLHVVTECLWEDANTRIIAARDAMAMQFSSLNNIILRSSDGTYYDEIASICYK